MLGLCWKARCAFKVIHHLVIWWHWVWCLLSEEVPSVILSIEHSKLEPKGLFGEQKQTLEPVPFVIASMQPIGLLEFQWLLVITNNIGRLSVP